MEELLANGPGDIVRRELQESRDVRSRAHWTNGAWTLVITRPLAASVGWDIDFLDSSPDNPRRVRKSAPLAVHVWDGLAGESDLRMAMSSWLYLVFEQPRPPWLHVSAFEQPQPPWRHVAAASTALLVAIIEILLARWYRRAATMPRVAA
ncbi:MAG: hypothetical protein HY000_15245 [Planctomycetes bacterium]|nr:hypothetical protein [Planctomycetota bacterium]